MAVQPVPVRLVAVCWKLDKNMLLIIFTRYPEAGLVKTRLIPALGKAGAAEIQKTMTEETVKMVLKTGIEVEIHFSGGSYRQIKKWLGIRLNYREQQGETLGEKLSYSFQRAFSAGLKQVVIIGTDCPQITPDHINTAFAMLQKSDLVLGPALDGGYYLIGLSNYQPELFRNIKWGSSVVFEQTLAAAHKLQLEISELETLADIDRPEDLPAWLQRK